MKATGGAWDRDDWPVCFCASVLGALEVTVKHHPYILVAVNEMLAPGTYRAGRAALERWIAGGAKVFLDSGVFWLTNEHKRAHGMTMDQALALAPNEIDGFDELFARYVELCRAYGDSLWGYVELDQGGKDRKRVTRARLQDEYGLSPIPVYHPLNDGRDYFDELVEGYDRMCFGNVVQASPGTRRRLLHMMWEVRARHPDCWIHLLGVRPTEMLLAYPAQSVDTSSYLAALRWAHDTVRTSTMLKAVSNFPPNFAYRRGEQDSYEEANRQCSHAVAEAQATWRAVLADRAALGWSPYELGPLA